MATRFTENVVMSLFILPLLSLLCPQIIDFGVKGTGKKYEKEKKNSSHILQDLFVFGWLT